MNHTYYVNLWLEARKDLEKVIISDDNLKNAEPIEEREIVESELFLLYFRYRRVVRSMIVCHDNIIQPQIRDFVQRILEQAIIRMLEIRGEIVNFSFYDHPWPNDVLLEYQWTMDDVELTAPIYNLAIKIAKSERRRRLFENYLIGYNQSDDDDDSYDQSEEANGEETGAEDYQSIETKAPEDDKSNASSNLSEVLKPPEIDEEAERKAFAEVILLIQSHERARVGRNIAKNTVYKKMLRSKLDSPDYVQKKVDPKWQVIAAIIIQKVWRGFSTRRKLRERSRAYQEAMFMTYKSGGSEKAARQIDEIVKETSHMQVKAAKKLDKLIRAEEQKLLDVRGPALVDDIREELRLWFFDWYEKAGFFDYIPPAESGGSQLITTGEVRTPEEYYNSLKAQPPAPVKDDEDEDAKPQADTGWSMQESKVVSLLKDYNEEYLVKWSPHENEMLDPEAPLIQPFIVEEICYKMQKEMREIADESMRIELDVLNEALALDRQGLGVVPPKPQQFPPIVEEEKPPCDNILPHVSDDDLAIELMRSEVLVDWPECRLSDWPGVPTYGFRGKEKIPRLGDLRHAIMDYCVLPLGSKTIHARAPFNRSICICGPPGAGQLFIARAICNEVKATVFDLSPMKHRSRYKTRRSQNRLVQIVMRLSRAFAPSIILVSNEWAWINDLRPELMRYQPKRFTPIYKRLMSFIEPGDQVLFLTASSEPYLANKSFIKSHDKFIIIPVADYGTTFLSYKKSLLSEHAIPRDFPVSGLARVVTKDMPLDYVEAALEHCTKIERRMDYKRRPLKPEEVTDILMSFEDRPEPTQLELFESFRLKIGLEKKRDDLVEELKQDEMNKEKGKDN